jgi:RimJ/RimL family protein N-acetyltransferase
MEAGWVVAGHAQGKGYAREAMKAILTWSEEAHPGKPVRSIIQPDNARSVRLADDLGLTEIARRDYNGAPTFFFIRR